MPSMLENIAYEDDPDSWRCQSLHKEAVRISASSDFPLSRCGYHLASTPRSQQFPEPANGEASVL